MCRMVFIVQTLQCISDDTKAGGEIFSVKSVRIVNVHSLRSCPITKQRDLRAGAGNLRCQYPGMSDFHDQQQVARENLEIAQVCGAVCKQIQPEYPGRADRLCGGRLASGG